MSRVHDPPRAQRCNTSSYPNSLLDAAKIAHIIAHADVSLQQKRAYSALVRAFASAKRRVRTVIVGGSVTHGTSCEDREHGLKETECAYAARFGTYLRCHYAHKQIHVLNRARGGVTSAAALPLLPAMLRIYDDDAVQEADADWLLVDFSSNDAAFGYYYGATNFSRSDSLETSPVAAATEVMLRYLIAEHPSLPILVIESTCHSHATRHAHERAARQYGVPFLAYADALSNGTACSKAWHLAGHSHVHPTWETHAVLAEMLAQWWRAFSASLLPTRESVAPPAKVDDGRLGPYLTSASTRAPFGVCGSPVTVFDAHDTYAARRDRVMDAYAAYAAAANGSRASRRAARDIVEPFGHGWELYEDRPSKPGWITSTEGATLEFNLTFGAAPRLLLLYEAGYEGWGEVHLHLGERTSRRGAPFIPVSGLRTGGERVTQAELLAIECGIDPEGSRNNHNIRPFANATLKLVFASKPPLRFKVMHVSSC